MTTKPLYLNNPFGGEPALFNVVTTSCVPDETNEIFQTINFLSQDFPELQEVLKNYQKIPKRFEKFYDSVKTLCDSFNEWTTKNMTEIRSKYSNTDPLTLRPSTKLAKFILHLIYNRAIQDPDKLNHYEPFSPQVYGETSFDLIEKMIKRVKLKENDIFMDLGSGVGNVVLQVAALTKCKRCYGFEKAEWPAFYAEKMEKEFKYWIRFFGRTYTDFRLYKGDFLSEEEYLETQDEPKRKVTTGGYVKELIDQSNLIFVNNFAFGAEVDHQLKLRFLDMLEGSFIVSSKPFCSLNFRINDRNMNDFGAILNLNVFEPLNGHVSWTDKPIHYYFQKIDRTLLEKYYESKYKPVERPTRPKNRSSNSPRSANSSSSSSDSSSNSSSNSDSSLNISLHSKKSHRTRSNSKENKKRKSSSLVAEKDKQSKQHVKKKTKISKETKERTRSKSLDKEEKKTLDKMHHQVSKVTKIEKEEKSLNGSLKSSGKDTALKDNFNQKTMTKLTSENLDTKSLKDSKISVKFTKHLNSIKIPKQNGISSKLVNGVNNQVDFDSNDLDEDKARSELGDEIMNSIDNYFKKCRQQYINYIMYMKSSEYKEKVNLEYQKELNLKKDLLVKKEELENQKKTLIKNNISLLKQRAAELGIKDLKSPSQLLLCAKQILAQHKELEEKMNSILETVSNKNTQQQTPQTSSQDSIILTKLVNTIEQNEAKNQPEKQDDSDKNGTNQINDLKSVGSNQSGDETLTATERADEEDDELNGQESNENDLENSKLKPTRPHSNPVPNTQPIPSRSIMDKIFHKEDRVDSLKSFKIPKQSRKESTNSDDKPVSPGLFSVCSSNSTNNPRSPQSAFETNISRHGKHSRNLSGDFNLEFSSSSSSSPSASQTESKPYSNYYHPKKKYMMENSNFKFGKPEEQETTNGLKTKDFETYRNQAGYSTQSSSVGSSQT